MRTSLPKVAVLTLILWTTSGIAAAGAAKKPQQKEKYTKVDAERMIAAAEGTLAPVYAPLAEEIVSKLSLGEKEGLGIDLGSGPGTLIVELCKRTKLHWINADINPHFFPYFFDKANARGFGGRVSAVRANACALPFRDNLADVVVSRGSFHFWPDTKQGLAEVYRVLKPGGVAYIGRGFPSSLGLAIAKKIRSRQGKGMKYNVDETETQLREIMRSLGIEDYTIERPKPNNPPKINYGLWLEFHKRQG